VYHFMFDPSWDEGCVSCSMFVDSVDDIVTHLAARNTAFAVVSRAPVEKLEAFKQRMGWSFRWLSSGDSDFNYDFQVTLDDSVGSDEYNYTSAETLRTNGKIFMDELPGLSVLVRDGERLLHAYSTYGRGLDQALNVYNFLDLTPLGRQDDEAWAMAWVRHHDRYTA
jgi:predicted dithiol-disulfide oxidoreductase (DUF899 family)